MPKYYFHLDSTVPYFDQDGSRGVDGSKIFTRDIEVTLQPGQDLRLEVRRGEQPLYVLVVSSSRFDVSG